MALADCVNQALMATQAAVGNARSADPEDVPKLILKRAEERRAAAPVRFLYLVRLKCSLPLGSSFMASVALGAELCSL